MANDDPIRAQMAALFSAKLGLDETESRDLEVGLYNSAIDQASAARIPLNWRCEMFRDIYLCRGRHIYANLCEDSYVKNRRLMHRLRNGEFAPHELADLSATDMFPEKWKALIEKEIWKAQGAYENNETSMSDRIVCPKCRQKRVKYYELQMRSADEPMTTICTCLSCSYKWKF